MLIEMLLVRPAYVKISKALSGHLPYELFTLKVSKIQKGYEDKNKIQTLLF